MVVSKGTYHPIDEHIGISVHRLGSELWTIIEKVSDPCPPSPTPYTALLYLRNGLTDCVQIWYVGWGSLTKCLPQVIGGVHPFLHVRTCAPLSHKCSSCCHSVTVGPIALKFMSVKLATATATDSASVTDFVQNGHEGAVWPADSKNQVHFDLGSLLQGHNQGQTKGNALAPKLTVRLR